ncbi:MAG: hypothetical protein KGP29_00250 [Proteobacteria bacterium]|nr:hypothetical protein [Pseudomonadota bacterium]
MKKIILFAILFCAASCNNKVIDIKSPCVSTEDGPCGPKKPVNEWWLKNYKNS